MSSVSKTLLMVQAFLCIVSNGIKMDHIYFFFFFEVVMLKFSNEAP